MAEDRSSASPRRSRDGGGGGGGGGAGGAGGVASGNCNYALAIVRRFNANARITGVVGVGGDATVVKLNPGDGTTHQQLAALTALRIAFPFCSVTAIESAASGDTELQILVSTDGEAFRHAKVHYAQRRPFRALRAASNAMLLLSLVSYICLLHAASISHPHEA